MALYDPGEAFAQLAAEMARVGDVLSTQNISQVIETFDGSNVKLFREWVASIDKYSKLAGLPAARKKMIALRASTGPVSGFIQRYTASVPDLTWDALRRELAKRFSDVTDPQFALSVLRNVRQKHDENIQVFAERILSLAEEAFQGQQGDAVERQLIDTFVDGLLDDQSKLRILRSRPDTLQGAIDAVTSEQNLMARVALSNMRNPRPDTSNRHDTTTFQKHNTQPAHRNFRNERRETPMEIDHYRPRPMRCFKCKRIGHLTKDCGSVSQVQQPEQIYDRRWERRKIVCWGCGQEGHFIRDCGRMTEQRNRQMNGRMTGQRNGRMTGQMNGPDNRQKSSQGN